MAPGPPADPAAGDWTAALLAEPDPAIRAQIWKACVPAPRERRAEPHRVSPAERDFLLAEARENPDPAVREALWREAFGGGGQ